MKTCVVREQKLYLEKMRIERDVENKKLKQEICRLKAENSTPVPVIIQNIYNTNIYNQTYNNQTYNIQQNNATATQLREGVLQYINSRPHSFNSIKAITHTMADMYSDIQNNAPQLGEMAKMFYSGEFSSESKEEQEAKDKIYNVITDDAIDAIAQYASEEDVKKLKDAVDRSNCIFALV